MQTGANDLSTCPHCGGKTALHPSAHFLWVCAACGGPRIPGASGKNEALSRARMAHTAGFGWSAGSLVLAVSGAMTAGLAALLWVASPTLGIVVGTLAALVLLFAWRAAARAGARRREAKQATREGWRAAALQVLRARARDTSTAELADQLRIDERAADRLLTELSARDEAHIDIEDGTVKYRVEPGSGSESASGSGSGSESESGSESGSRGRA